MRETDPLLNSNSAHDRTTDPLRKVDESYTDVTDLENAIARTITRDDPSLISRTRSNSLNIIGDFLFLNRNDDLDDKWGATPGVRKNWSRRMTVSVAPEGLLESIDSTHHSKETASSTTYSTLASCIDHFPGLLIAIILNLFLSMSFGNAFFTSSWEFPPDIPRSIGVSMFLFSTLISQIVLTYSSDFNVAIGMMMVENIPFMHAIEDVAVAEQGMGRAAFATVMVAFALSSVLVGIMFFCLGYYKIGSSVYFIPRHCIIGCIGGIGVFIFKTGLEVSTNTPLDSISAIRVYISSNLALLWCVPAVLELFLRLFTRILKMPLLPPFYFCAIPPLFYIALLTTGTAIQTAHDAGWFFAKSPPSNPLLIWTLFDFSLVNWIVIWKSVPTIIALCIFSLMHAPINIPSLTISTGVNVNMDNEMMNHGYSNVLSGLCGGLQNYMCYSNSLLYFKCNGRGKVSGYLLCLLLSAFFAIGPSIVEHVPRCMAGCLLLHVGVDLTTEALVDTYSIFDRYEYATIVIITLIMTTLGMTAGLAFCVICAALTFTLQEGNFISPIRGSMSASTLRSSKWRSQAALDVILPKLRHVTVFQLQGTLFFGNASSISKEISEFVVKAREAVWFIIVDFTLVVSIDSTAANTLSKLVEVCKRNNVQLCYCRGSSAGFPTFFPLTETITNSAVSGKMKSNFGYSVAICDTMDESLSWCEDAIESKFLNSNTAAALDVALIKNDRRHLWQLYCLCPDGDIENLMLHFSLLSIDRGTVLWRQSDSSDSAILIISGELTSFLEDEAGTTEILYSGHLLGEYTLIYGLHRLSTVIASSDCELLILTKDAYEKMQIDAPYLAILFAKISIGYLGRRLQHVSNRVWESRCIPI